VEVCTPEKAGGMRGLAAFARAGAQIALHTTVENHAGGELSDFKIQFDAGLVLSQWCRLIVLS
jgi:hypothetical protein